MWIIGGVDFCELFKDNTVFLLGNEHIFFSLKDEDKDVRCKATELWEQVGHKYEEENMDQLKQEIDFDVITTDYPSGGEHPKLDL